MAGQLAHAGREGGKQKGGEHVWTVSRTSARDRQAPGAAASAPGRPPASPASPGRDGGRPLPPGGGGERSPHGRGPGGACEAAGPRREAVREPRPTGGAASGAGRAAAGLPPAGQVLREAARSGGTDGRTAMWTSLGTVTESAGRRAASCRFWAVVLGAAAGVFLVGFLIGTVRSNPPSDRGRGGSPGHPPLFQPGSGLGAGPKGPRVGKERAGFQRPGPCARGARSEGVLGRPTAPALPTLHTGQSPTPPGISSSSAGEGGLCLFDLFRLRLK